MNKHKQTIRKHRKYVRQMCWKMGLFWQGLTHDLSKYSKEEMSIAKYANGTRSPHDIARDELGYSPAWIYHYHRNKHHWEFWMDYRDAIEINGEMYIKPTPIKIPYKYMIEMFCDFVGAGKAYMGDKWTVHAPLQYYEKACKGQRIMHRDSEQLLVVLLKTLDSCADEEEFFMWYKGRKKWLKAIYGTKN